jgi:hypothetical protein
LHAVGASTPGLAPSRHRGPASARRDGRFRVRAVRQDGRPGRRRRRAVARAGPAGPRGRRLPAALSRPSSRRPTSDARAGVSRRRALERRPPVRLLSAPADGYRLRLVDHPPSYDRPDYYVADGADYPDNGFRFALLGRAALEAMRAEGVPADVVHGHDWEARRRCCCCATATPTIRCWPDADGADLPQPGLPRLGAAGPTVAAQLDLPPSVGAPTASTCCARASSPPTWSTRSARRLPASRSAGGAGRGGRAARAGRPLRGHPQRPRHRAVGPGHRRALPAATRPTTWPARPLPGGAVRELGLDAGGPLSGWSAGSTRRRASTC